MLKYSFFVAVTWGLNLFDPYVFADVPRTVADAVADDWTLLSSCGGNSKCASNFHLFAMDKQTDRDILKY